MSYMRLLWFALCLMLIPFAWREKIEERVFEGK